MFTKASRVATLRATSSPGLFCRVAQPSFAASRVSISDQAVEDLWALHSKRLARTSTFTTTTASIRQSRRFVQESSQPSRRTISDVRNETHISKRNVYVALGSNMGNRVAMIEQACKEMESNGKMRIVRTSSLWESKAMYVLDQDHFVNGVCEIETWLSPIELLDELQAIERNMGRVKVIEKGPRNIDLDILLFGEMEHSDERLQIPHSLMFEREFVLRPLCELISQSEQAPSPFKASIHRRLKELPKSEVPLVPIVPLAAHLSPVSWVRAKNSTRIMSILNVTPDSFSDGGNNYNLDEATLATKIRTCITDGATIIDVGGQSTRPGAIQVSTEEELARVVPAVKLIRSMPEADSIAISLDTYRARVADEAIKAGANMINDVSAGTLDDAMLPTMGRLGCTVCLMHMRGTPTTMNSPDMTWYPDGIVETVGRELVQRVRAAEEAGVRRWRIILDPGIGFAKTQEHNLELLRSQHKLIKYPGLEGIPWLVGASRKAFIGQITGVKEPQDRVWGTAIAVSAAIQGGADILRVHDVKEMAQVANMADALWRRGP